jgi:hypothetical protein
MAGFSSVRRRRMNLTGNPFPVHSGRPCSSCYVAANTIQAANEDARRPQNLFIYEGEMVL